mmetsp:Transcript_6268/g.16718  ORF Transcript_6268/g.16718 Transcript_6268/m.16718 type:complete len:1408 (-) Transcript_6268:11-4234(-)
MAAKVGKYFLFETLGTGSFGKVKLAVDQESGEHVAVKVLDKAEVARLGVSENVRKEVAVMKALQHPNIVRVRQVLASAQKIYIVMDLVTGGELFAKIAADGPFSSERARHFFHQLVSAIAYCHKRGIFHRDIKPENLLIEDGTDHLKITDFGLAASANNDPDRLMHTYCGSPVYCAPEIVGGNSAGYCGDKADIWACGIVLYAMLAGALPFHDNDMDALISTIQHDAVYFPSTFPDDARSLCQKLLEKDPKKRITIEAIKRDPWFTGTPRQASESPAAAMEPSPVGGGLDNERSNSSREEAVSKPKIVRRRIVRRVRRDKDGEVVEIIEETITEEVVQDEDQSLQRSGSEPRRIDESGSPVKESGRKAETDRTVAAPEPVQESKLALKLNPGSGDAQKGSSESALKAAPSSGGGIFGIFKPLATAAVKPVERKKSDDNHPYMVDNMCDSDDDGMYDDPDEDEGASSNSGNAARENVHSSSAKVACESSEKKILSSLRKSESREAPSEVDAKFADADSSASDSELQKEGPEILSLSVMGDAESKREDSADCNTSNLSREETVNSQGRVESMMTARGEAQRFESVDDGTLDVVRLPAFGSRTQSASDEKPSGTVARYDGNERVSSDVVEDSGRPLQSPQGDAEVGKAAERPDALDPVNFEGNECDATAASKIAGAELSHEDRGAVLRSPDSPSGVSAEDSEKRQSARGGSDVEPEAVGATSRSYSLSHQCDESEVDYEDVVIIEDGEEPLAGFASDRSPSIRRNNRTLSAEAETLASASYEHAARSEDNDSGSVRKAHTFDHVLATKPPESHEAPKPQRAQTSDALGDVLKNNTDANTFGAENEAEFSSGRNLLSPATQMRLSARAALGGKSPKDDTLDVAAEDGNDNSSSFSKSFTETKWGRKVQVQSPSGGKSARSKSDVADAKVQDERARLTALEKAKRYARKLGGLNTLRRKKSNNVQWAPAKVSDEGVSDDITKVVRLSDEKSKLGSQAQSLSQSAAASSASLGSMMNAKPLHDRVCRAQELYQVLFEIHRSGALFRSQSFLVSAGELTQNALIARAKAMTTAWYASVLADYLSEPDAELDEGAFCAYENLLEFWETKARDESGAVRPGWWDPHSLTLSETECDRVNALLSCLESAEHDESQVVGDKGCGAAVEEVADFLDIGLRAETALSSELNDVHKKSLSRNPSSSARGAGSRSAPIEAGDSVSPAKSHGRGGAADSEADVQSTKSPHSGHVASGASVFDSGEFPELLAPSGLTGGSEVLASSSSAMHDGYGVRSQTSGAFGKMRLKNIFNRKGAPETTNAGANAGTAQSTGESTASTAAASYAGRSMSSATTAASNVAAGITASLMESTSSLASKASGSGGTGSAIPSKSTFGALRKPVFAKTLEDSAGCVTLECALSVD